MKFGVVVFPGSNCDRDMYDALSHDLGFEVRMLWHKDKDLSGFTSEDCIVLPGGFSYGDYLRCGAIAPLQPGDAQSLPGFIAQRGGRVLGVLQWVSRYSARRVSCRGPCCRTRVNNLSVRIVNIQGQDGRVLQIPIAHGEGLYYADEATLDRLEANGSGHLPVLRRRGTRHPLGQSERSHPAHSRGFQRRKDRVWHDAPSRGGLLRRLWGISMGRKYSGRCF